MSVCRLHISCFQVYIHHIGVYISDEHCEDQALFVTERCCFSDLVEGLSSPCPCGLTVKPWALEAVMQVSNIVAASVVSCLSQSSCIIERSRVTCAVLLLPMPSAKEDVVEFKSAQWALPS